MKLQMTASFLRISTNMVYQKYVNLSTRLLSDSRELVMHHILSIGSKDFVGVLNCITSDIFDRLILYKTCHNRPPNSIAFLSTMCLLRKVYDLEGLIVFFPNYEFHINVTFIQFSLSFGFRYESRRYPKDPNHNYRNHIEYLMENLVLSECVSKRTCLPGQAMYGVYPTHSQYLYLPVNKIKWKISKLFNSRVILFYQVIGSDLVSSFIVTSAFNVTAHKQDSGSFSQIPYLVLNLLTNQFTFNIFRLLTERVNILEIGLYVKGSGTYHVYNGPDMNCETINKTTRHRG